MRPKGMTKADLEATSPRGGDDGGRGMSCHEVARRLGCAPSSVIRWRQNFVEGGRDAIRAIPEEGKQHGAYLDDDDRAKLAALIVRGPRAAGFSTDLWSLSRIRILVEREFGVTYSVGHLHRIMASIGFSAQKPEKRAREQDPRP